MHASGSVCGRAQTGKGARRRLRPHAPVCACPYPSVHARTRLPTPLPVCARARPYRLRPCAPLPSTHAVTRLHAPLPVCAPAHPSACVLTRLRAPLASARALRQRGFRFDTLASLKLPTVKKKNGKKIFTRRCPPKEDGRTSMSVCPRPKPTSKPPCPSS